MLAPAISVCVVGARRDALDACLLSLLAQEDAPEVELLVSVDRSCEDAVAAVARARFPQARLCVATGLLPGASRNELLSCCRSSMTT
ncbi:MAG: hypothetical protein ACR2ND_03575 [Solirubrobacteraceae bacterium]